MPPSQMSLAADPNRGNRYRLEFTSSDDDYASSPDISRESFETYYHRSPSRSSSTPSSNIETEAETENQSNLANNPDSGSGAESDSDSDSNEQDDNDGYFNLESQEANIDSESSSEAQGSELGSRIHQNGFDTPVSASSVSTATATADNSSFTTQRVHQNRQRQHTQTQFVMMPSGDSNTFILRRLYPASGGHQSTIDDIQEWEAQGRMIAVRARSLSRMRRQRHMRHRSAVIEPEAAGSTQENDIHVHDLAARCSHCGCQCYTRGRTPALQPRVRTGTAWNGAAEIGAFLGVFMGAVAALMAIAVIGAAALKWIEE